MAYARIPRGQRKMKFFWLGSSGKLNRGGNIYAGPWWLDIILKCQDGELAVPCHITFG